jgi:transcriptional pleiotropic regulator of transition state genes
MSLKSTGIVRRIDDLGRIVIPKELRRTFGLKNGDPIEIFVDGDRIVLRKYVEDGRCVICGGNGEPGMVVHGKPVCRGCVDEIDQLVKRVQQG